VDYGAVPVKRQMFCRLDDALPDVGSERVRGLGMRWWRSGCRGGDYRFLRKRE